MFAVITNEEWKKNMETVKKRMVEEVKAFDSEKEYEDWADGETLETAIDLFLEEINIYYSDKEEIDI